MRWLERLENRLTWIAVPGLFKYLALLGVAVSIAGWVSPAMANAIAFDRQAILEGEFWRIFAFAFAPMGLFPPTLFGALFLVFGTLIAFLINDSLEEVWGPTRTTLYLIATWLGLVIGQFVFDPGVMTAGVFLYMSMFFAFATHFPRYEFRLFLILPVQVRWIAWFIFAGLVFSILGSPPLIGVVVATLISYALWVLPKFVRERKTLARAAVRRRKFHARSGDGAGESFHHCEVCKRTERDDPDLEFRTCLDGTEYCVDHLPESETGDAGS
jgi:hypothetical protein